MQRIVVPVIGICLSLFFHTGSTVAQPPTPLILNSAAAAIEAELEALDRDLAAAAEHLAAMDLDGNAARALLEELQTAREEVVIDICTISPEGTMRMVVPDAYRSFEGTDISDQAQFQALVNTRRPVMSALFETVEGLAAIDIEQPILGPGGELLGSVSAIFKPWVLINKALQGILAGIPVEIWAMQTDGCIIFDDDPEELGRNLFSDPLYMAFPKLVQLGRQIAAEKQGYGLYSFYKAGTSETILKKTWWITIGLHGTEWRLVSIHQVDDSTDRSTDGKTFSLEALRTLSREPGLTQALAAADGAIIVQTFKDTVTAYSNIYNLSWIDAKAVSRYGYPPENSLSDVDLGTHTDAVSTAIVAATKNRCELLHESVLFEGGRARFAMVPVMDGENYLGSLLWIEEY